MTLKLMYFQNYELRKKWLDKYLKRPVSEHRSTVNMTRYMVPNTAKICTAELLSYFLITLTQIELESVSPGNI